MNSYIGRWATDSGGSIFSEAQRMEKTGLILYRLWEAYMRLESESNAGVRLWVKESITSRLSISGSSFPTHVAEHSPNSISCGISRINEPCVSGFTRKILSCGRWSAVYHFNELSRTEAFGRVGFGPRQVQRHHKARWTVFLPPTSREHLESHFHHLPAELKH